jgi:hypothetical protein
MPKQILEINPFHGGLNNNGDPRDIKIEELSQAQDIMVDEIGKVRTMGSHVGHDADTNSTTIEPGYGLFQFSHDRLEGEAAGSAAVETGDDYLAMADVATSQIDIYSRFRDTWGTNRIDLGSETSGMKAVFYSADGALRVSDGNFGDDNETMWYGYVYRYFFGDGTTGADSGVGAGYSQGLLVDKWHSDEASLKALPIKSFFGLAAGATPDISSPISVDIDSNATDTKTLFDSTDTVVNGDTDSVQITVTFAASSPNVTVVSTSGGSLTPGLGTFCIIGDKILIEDAADAGNNTIFTVSSVSTDSTSPNTMDFEETVAAETGDRVYMYNLSRSLWFDPINTGWQCAVSTLYDDSNQESALSISSTTLQPSAMTSTLSDGSSGYAKFRIDCHVFAGDGSTTGLPVVHPRVSGFKVYMRRENTSIWYLQTVIGMTKGNKWFGRGDYEMWEDGADMTACAHADGEYLTSPREVETYESETGFDSSIDSVGFDGTGTGFKTAVVTNRRAYVGNIKIKDELGVVHVLQDAILKSRVNSFDAFSIKNIIEATVNDGSSIVKLEEYADRLLEFKQDKMTLINISQSIEFLEDVFLHKGVVAPSATCKTDYGIAWVNENGCYLYDGQRVNDLLEKGGVQIIKESEWRSFIGAIPMIGYIPKKRQLIVATSAGTGSNNGNIYLYDLVTKSWVQGDSKLTDNQSQTNFVTDWNGDLVHAHTSGTVVKWDDTSAVASNMLFATKDLTFGKAGQRKKLYKVYLTYKGDGSSLVAKYATDGETDSSDFLQFNSTNNPLADKSSAENLESWHLAELKPTTSSEANNIYSAKFHLSGAAGASFEINDINIVFRAKNIK